MDPQAVAAWRRQQSAEDAQTVLAADMPDLLADAAFEAFKSCEGPHKRELAGALVGAWYLMSATVLERLEEKPPATYPEKIERLRAIFDASCTLPIMSIDMPSSLVAEIVDAGYADENRVAISNWITGLVREAL